MLNRASSGLFVCSALPTEKERTVRKPPTEVHNPNPRKFITHPQLRERYGGRSEMWASRMMAQDPDFPRPVYYGRYQFFEVTKLDRYDRIVAARRTGGAR
jgi:hypothetical protein